MNSALFLQVVTIAADAFIFIFVGFYLWSLVHDKKKLEDQEKDLAAKKAKIDTEFQEFIKNAQVKEKEILDNATRQANLIISNAQYVSSSSKEIVDKALSKMIADIEKEASASTGNYLNNYKSFLNQISQKSLGDFQNLTKNFEGDLGKKMQEFRDTLLPALQKELDEYKNKRLMEADKKINEIIEKVSQKVLNKSLSPEDHKNLIIESLEKAKKENIFD